jgi:uronate dehydrogenase
VPDFAEGWEVMAAYDEREITSQTLLITGGSGYIGGVLRASLSKPRRQIRLFDAKPPPAESALRDNETFIAGSVNDLDALRSASRGADVIIHLAALHDTRLDGADAWPAIQEVNIGGTFNVFEAARHERVRRVVFASSNHTVGFYPRNRAPAPDYLFPMPDTFYGVSKVAGEALGSLYHHRYGLDVICLRILTCVPRPRDIRSLATWLSPGDTGRLFEAAIATPVAGFVVAWGVSANSRAWFDMGEATRLGYSPQDDAESYCDEVTGDNGSRFLGGLRAVAHHHEPSSSNDPDRHE